MSVFKDILIAAGIFVAAYGLRSFAHPLMRRLGVILFLGGSYYLGWSLTGSHWGGFACLAVWFLLPWLEILFRIRKLLLPLDKRYHSCTPPNRDEFPHLGELTGELVAQGFEQHDDAGWVWEDMQQFVRIFAHPEKRLQAVIHHNQQNGVCISFVSVTTRLPDGITLTTWNYPFAYTMKLAPGFLLNRAADARSFEELLERHEVFESNFFVDELREFPDPETIPKLMEDELRRQVDHNLSKGILQLAGEGRFRYSWRGCFFLWREFIKDFVRLS